MRYRLSSFVLLPLSIVVILACSDSSLLGQIKPKAATTISQLRDWKDVTGNHTIRAKFLGVIDRSKVALKTADGKEMTIELSRLSSADIYQAVKADLMAQLASTAPASKPSPRKKVKASPRNKFQPSSRKKLVPTDRIAKPSSRKVKSSARKTESSQTLPVSKPRPTVADDLVTEFIETIENEDTETIFETILNPKEFTAFTKSSGYKAGLEKFEKDKKARLLEALQSIDYKSIERKPGGKYQFKTDSAPITFKKLKGSWYLNN